MLVRRLGAIALTLECLVLLATGPAFAGQRDTSSDALAKRLAAKSADRDGYAPALARSAAEAVVEVEPNDSPAQAQPVAVGDVVDASVPEGDVDWFAVTGESGTYLTVSTSSRDGSIADTVLEVFGSDAATLLAVDDDGGMGLFSAIEHLLVPDDGIVLVRVTRFGPLGDDLYSLSVEDGVAPPPVPENDTPASAVFLEICNTALTGSTVGATSASAGVACVEFDPLGGDVFFAVDLLYSYQLTAQVEPLSGWDPSIYLFTDPSDPAGSCLIGTDEAFADEIETVIYTNEDETSASMRIYMAVDSWEPGQAGSFALRLNCDFVVSNDSESWGGLKARFDR
jgi:hypothetical protein